MFNLTFLAGVVVGTGREGDVTGFQGSRIRRQEPTGLIALLEEGGTGISGGGERHRGAERLGLARGVSLDRPAPLRDIGSFLVV